MAYYVDAYVLPVRTNGLKQYKKLARLAGKIWMEHGALEYHECMGEDMSIKGLVKFPKMAGAKKGETVIFAWVKFKSRKHRDRVNAKVMKDKRMKNFDPGDMPFDCKRMAYGGFSSIVDFE